MEKIVFFDVETGGLNEEKHSLLSIGLAVYQNNIKLDEIELFLKEEKYIVDEDAMKVNKINLDKLKEIGITEDQAVKEITQFIKRNFGNDLATLAGHNVYFDMAFLKRFLRKNNVPFNELFSHRTIDTCSIMKFLGQVNIIPNKIDSLTKASNYFNILIEDTERHGALYDANLTASIYYNLLSTIENKYNNENSLIKKKKM